MAVYLGDTPVKFYLGNTPVKLYLGNTLISGGSTSVDEIGNMAVAYFENKTASEVEA